MAGRLVKHCGREADRWPFEYSSYGVGEPAEMELIVFTPLEEDGAARKLAELLREASQG